MLVFFEVHYLFYFIYFILFYFFFFVLTCSLQFSSRPLTPENAAEGTERAGFLFLPGHRHCSNGERCIDLAPY